MVTICVINYGMGNIASVVNALEKLGAAVFVSDQASELGKADGLILPGVGAFPAAMRNLTDLNLCNSLTDLVFEKQKPLLGICLGMQLMAEESEELGSTRGLGWIPGRVRLLNPGQGLRVPHVGWNEIRVVKPCPMFERMGSQADVYFDHAYQLECPDGWVTATCDYGDDVVAAIGSGNLQAVQFHPEKSQRAGLKILRGFLNSILRELERA